MMINATMVRRREWIVSTMCVAILFSVIVSCSAATAKSSSKEFEKGMKAYAVKDYEKAFPYFQKAAEKGDAEAQFYVGECYERGRGVKKDEVEAMEWYHQSAEAGFARAQLYLGLRMKDNEAQSTYWFRKGIETCRKAAEQGDAKAQFNLGVCYFWGYGVDVEMDDDEALKWLLKAAEQGIAEAQYSLGQCYFWGYGVEADDVKAMEWFHKAANQGCIDAYDMLAELAGEDEAERTYWRRKMIEFYRKDAEQGDAEAQLRLGGLCEDSKEAMQWCRKAAEQGYAEAQYALGYKYEEGLEVPQDYVEAVKWYRKAAEQGHGYAMSALGRCYENGYGVPKDEEEGQKWYIESYKKGDPPSVDDGIYNGFL